MPLYEVSPGGLSKRPVANFAALGIYERQDLQRLLRDEPSALGEDLLIIAEEFGQWEDARRRIDLLALDPQGHLVVIELKRTDDGGHMELQALRYAAMVSSMGFEEVAAAFAAHRQRHPSGQDEPRAELLQFLSLTSQEEEQAAISSEVRIVLVAADFGREITTAVLWLNRFDGMDIRCIRLVPYDVDGKILLDIQQVIPLPEAADYQVRLRRKELARERSVTLDEGRYTRYHVIVDGQERPDENKRNAVRAMVTSLVDRGVRLPRLRLVLPERKFRTLEGVHDSPEDVAAALLAAAPAADPARFFVNQPFVDREAGRTYVLSNQWGTDTEGALSALTSKFPEAGVTFRRAGPEAEALA